jgi:hypothetical protein
METDVYQGGCMQKTKNRIRERQLSNGWTRQVIPILMLHGNSGWRV